jgi:hypothetical protein
VSEPTQARRDELLLLIADLWRSDWSGHVFDGKDGAGWITTAVTGDDAALDELHADLVSTVDSY